MSYTYYRNRPGELILTIRCCLYCCRKVVATIKAPNNFKWPYANDDNLPLEILKKYGYNCPRCGSSLTIDFEMEDYEKFAIERAKKTRICLHCGDDISDRPSWHYMCLSCWKRIHSTNNYTDDDENDDDYSYSYDRPDTIYEALEGNEDAYYNLYGELPPDDPDDW